MSTVEPFGTWQYAHSVCRPAGARRAVEQARLGDEHERALRVPAAATVASAAAISSNVPPTCTVAADDVAGSRHGTGSDRA